MSVRSLPSEVANALRPAVFLDRDGTIMHDCDYCSRPEQVVLIDGADSALRRIHEAGFLLIIITNQSGIGRGLLSIAQFQSVSQELDRQLGEGIIARTYFCAARPDSGDPRRKPSPQMVFEAIRDFGIDLNRSWFIGDKAIDMECGRGAGVRTILVQTGYGQSEKNAEADFIVPTIVEGADLILERTSDTGLRP